MTCPDHAAKRARARELRLAGWSRAQIARELGVSNSGGLTHWIKDIRSRIGLRGQRQSHGAELFMRWLDLIAVPRSRLILRIQIHHGADIRAAEGYWREATKIPDSQFRRPTLKRHNPITVRKNVGPRYVGCLTITVRGSTELYRRISGWYEGIVNDLGRRPTGRPPDFGSGNARSTRAAPATYPSTLFEPSPAYEWQHVG